MVSIELFYLLGREGFTHLTLYLVLETRSRSISNPEAGWGPDYRFHPFQPIPDHPVGSLRGRHHAAAKHHR